MARPGGAEMAEVPDTRFEEFAARMEERFDRVDEKSDERFARIEEAARERFARAEEVAEERFARTNERSDARFRELVGRIEQVDKNAKAESVRARERSEEVERRLTRLDHETDRLHDRLDDLVRLFIGGFAAFAGAVMACFGALIVLIATQL